MNMSLRHFDPSQVNLRLTWILGANGSCRKSDLVRQVVDICG